VGQGLRREDDGELFSLPPWKEWKHRPHHTFYPRLFLKLLIPTMKRTCATLAAVAAVLMSDASVQAAAPEERRFLRRVSVDLQALPCSSELQSVTCGPDREFFYNLCQAIKSGYSQDDCQSEEARQAQTQSSESSDQQRSTVDMERDLQTRTCGRKYRPVVCNNMEFFNFCQASLYGKFKRTQCKRMYYN
jgi:hypothetical protein